jgi:glycosyltransferase involved in cell wall biosynthesis
MINLAAGLSASDVRIDLVVANARGPYVSLLAPSVRLVDLGVSRLLRSIVPLAAYLRRERPVGLVAALSDADLVAMVAARLSRTRLRTVIAIHNTLGKEIQECKSLRVAVIPRLFCALQDWADAIVAVSDGVADDFAQTAGVPRHRIQVIYNPVITPAVLAAASAAAPHPWLEDNGCPVVLGAGRLVPQKNFQLLVEAFAVVRRARACRLLLLGEGPERANLEDLVRKHGLEKDVALPGFLDNPYACMARAATFVLSSNYEGLPTVLIESLAVGTPVVATDCESGPREILRGGALGELVPVGDVERLADAILRSLSKPRAPVPQAHLNSYSMDSVVRQFRAIFDLA